MKQLLPGNYDSEFCGNLPIHLINVIQPYGALIVYNTEDRVVIQLSENCEALLGVPIQEIHGRALSTFIPGLDQLRADPGKLPVACTINGLDYHVILHEKQGYSILEINLHSGTTGTASSFLDVYQDVRTAIHNIEDASTLEQAAELTARELKRASGFDKVMVYRFDTGWNGHVIAEACEPGMETYMGFTFPASDIPKQARDLYFKNAYRFIPDINYTPVKLYPVINPVTSTFIDLSDCNVRGVSAVHIEYLRNMQVTASMSTRIIKNGQLWGLIACHHRSAMEVNYKMCTVFELLSGIISARTASLDNEARHAADAELSAIYTNLIKSTYNTRDIGDSLLAETNNVMQLFKAEGAVLVHNGRTVTRGNVPSKEEINDLLLWLQTARPDQVYSTDHLSGEFDYAEEYKNLGSGMLAIPMDRAKDEYILLFRPEKMRVINWGGDPAGRLTVEADMKTYHPRYSFKLWQEQVNGMSEPWSDEQLGVAENLRVFIQEFLRPGKDVAFN